MTNFQRWRSARKLWLREYRAKKAQAAGGHHGGGGFGDGDGGKERRLPAHIEKLQKTQSPRLTIATMSLPAIVLGELLRKLFTRLVAVFSAI